MKKELARIVEDGQKLCEGKTQLEEAFKKVIEKISIEFGKIPDAKKGILSDIKGWMESWQESCLDPLPLAMIRRFDNKLPQDFQNFYEALREENIENREAIEIVERILKKLEN